MRVLLDTHTLVWFLSGADILPGPVCNVIEDGENDVFVSAASAYEVALKFQKGKWPEVGPLAADFVGICLSAGFLELPISLLEAKVAGGLPLDHADPFDRLIAAQAIVNEMTVLSIDPALDQFGVRRRWA